jgi:hypothetical protein
VQAKSSRWPLRSSVYLEESTTILKFEKCEGNSSSDEKGLRKSQNNFDDRLNRRIY